MIQHNARLSYKRLGQAVGLSISAVNERLKKLRAKGVIKGQVALIEPKSVGLDICAFIQVLIDRPENEAAFLERIGGLAEVQECHHVTGRFSYLLKVRTADTATLERLLKEGLKAQAGVVRTETLLVLSSPKETTELPLVLPEAGPDPDRPWT